MSKHKEKHKHKKSKENWEVLPNDKEGRKRFKNKLEKKLSKEEKEAKKKKLLKISGKIKPKKRKKLIKVVYEPHRCEHKTKEGKRCKKPAVGSGVLCKFHGGETLIRENLLPACKITSDLLKKGKFNPAVHPIEYIAYSKQGLSKVQIAAKFEVSLQALEDWFLRYQEMNIAYEAGKAMYEAYWLQIGHDNLTNTRFNASLYKFLTGNTLGYSEKQENKNFTTNVHGVLVVPGTCSDTEWEKEAKRAQEEDKVFDAQYEEL